MHGTSVDFQVPDPLSAEGTQVPLKTAVVDQDTLFPLASLTKLLTAVAVGLLVEEGKLAWSTRIKDVLDDFRMLDRDMQENLTIEMALSHQSRLYGYGRPSDQVNLK